MDESSNSNSSTMSTNNTQYNASFSIASKIDTIAVRNQLPYLTITEQPTNKFRFRYVSEMHGTHGCILAEKKERIQKVYPAVKLHNFEGNAEIRCTIVCFNNNATRNPHPHTLVWKQGNIESEDPHFLSVPAHHNPTQTILSDPYTVQWAGIGVIHTAKKNINEKLIKKYTTEKEYELGRKLTPEERLKVVDRVNLDKMDNINLNSVCLSFQAFTLEPGPEFVKRVALTSPIYSQPIHNMKCVNTSDLKICRISMIQGSCKGDEEVFIFVEKVSKKDIKIRFYELDEDGDCVIWEDYGRFLETDVHHQYAICFRTPPYKTNNINEPVDVYISLKRPSDDCSSEPRKFTYVPAYKDLITSSIIPRKRARAADDALGEISENLPLYLLQSESELSDIDTLLNTCSSSIPPYTTPSFEQFLNNLNGDFQDHETIENQSLFGKLESFCIDGGPSTSKSSNKKSVNMAEKVLKGVDKALKQSGDVQFVFKTLIEKSDEATNSNAFHCAVMNNDAEAARKLTEYLDKFCTCEEKKIILSQKNYLDSSVLVMAISYEMPDLAEYCLENGCDIRETVDEKSLLFYAVDNNNVECLSVLLKYAPHKDIKAVNKSGRNLLHEAVQIGNLEMVEKLVEKFDVDDPDESSGDTALHYAVKRCNVDIVKFLLKRDIAVNSTNMSGNTALHYACQLHGPEALAIVKLLIRHMADPWIENNDTENNDEEGKGKTAFHFAEDNAELLEFLASVDKTIKSDKFFDYEQDWKLLATNKICIDRRTSIKLAVLLENDDLWKTAANLLVDKDIIPKFENLPFPARSVLESIKTQITTKELLDLLEAIDIPAGVEIVRNMKKALARTNKKK